MVSKNGVVTGGIDVGTQTIKAVILKGDELLAQAKAYRGFEEEGVVEQQVWAEVLRKSAVPKSEIMGIGAVGADKDVISFASYVVSGVRALARGAIRFCPSVRTVIEAGAEHVIGVKCDETGRVQRSTQNDRCAAGAGSFVEAMARALSVSIEDLSQLSLKSERTIPLSSECAIFAETDVVSLIHAKTPKEDIARAIYDSICRRIASMMRKIGVEEDVVLVGGMAKGMGFAASLKRALGVDLLVLQNPEFITAIGAALITAEGNQV